MAARTNVLVPLAELHIDPEMQPRASGLSTDNLERLIASDSKTWPAILVTPNDSGYAVLDGAHRVEAATRLKLSELRCDVLEKGGYSDAVKANLDHGLPLPT